MTSRGSEPVLPEFHDESSDDESRVTPNYHTGSASWKQIPLAEIPLPYALQSIQRALSELEDLGRSALEEGRRGRGLAEKTAVRAAVSADNVDRWSRRLEERFAALSARIDENQGAILRELGQLSARVSGAEHLADHALDAADEARKSTPEIHVHASGFHGGVKAESMPQGLVAASFPTFTKHKKVAGIAGVIVTVVLALAQAYLAAK